MIPYKRLEVLRYCIEMCLLYEHEPDGFDSLITHLRAEEEESKREGEEDDSS